MRVGKTGGGVGTNQYAVKGRAKTLPTGYHRYPVGIDGIS